MRAFAVTPGRPDSARAIELPRPSVGSGEVLVRILEVGICATDSEINQGLYGDAPAGQELLVLGHEALGRLKDGTLVVPMVRRPCPSCRQCQALSQDMCESGDFTERGIKGLHGALCEEISEDPDLLVRLPPSARPYAVLLEPMSVVAKAVRHALLIQRRLAWSPRRALVVGAGPIGLLATLTLRLLDWKVVTAARAPRPCLKSELVEQAGAVYHSAGAQPLRDLPQSVGRFDLVIEASGSSQAAFEVAGALSPNGVLCLTSVTGGERVGPVPTDRLNCDLVLGNKLIFGTVNAGRVDFEEGLKTLARVDERFPGVLARMLTRRVSFEDGPGLFAGLGGAGIKTVFRVAEG